MASNIFILANISRTVCFCKKFCLHSYSSFNADDFDSIIYISDVWCGYNHLSRTVFEMFSMALYLKIKIFCRYIECKRFF